MELLFNIQNQVITRTDSHAVIGDSKNYLTARFTFSSDWTGKTKTAQFTKDKRTYDMLLVADVCSVPWEVLQGSGIISVNVFAGDLITVDGCTFAVQVSGLMSGQVPAAATPLIYQQILDGVSAERLAASLAANQASSAAISANSAAGAANTAAGTATSAAGNANQAAAAADSAASAANQAASDADLAADAATTAADAADTAAADATAAISHDAVNLVTNGDFSNGVTGWTAANSTLSALNNILSVTGDGSGSVPQTHNITPTPAIPTKKMYALAKLKITNAVATFYGLIVNGSTGGTSSYIAKATPVQNNVNVVSGIVTLPSNVTGNIRLSVYHQYASAATANGKVMEVQQVIAIDLTALYGAGNEPTTAAEFDLVMANFANSWFDGTEQITAKIMLDARVAYLNSQITTHNENAAAHTAIQTKIVTDISTHNSSTAAHTALMNARISDSTIETDKLWSSTKVNSEINTGAIYVGHVSRAVNTEGAQDVACGFRPKFVRIRAFLSAQNHCESEGISDGTNTRSIQIYQLDALAPVLRSTTTMLYLHDGATNANYCSIAFTDTGFTLTWVNLGSLAAGNILMMIEAHRH